VHPSLYKVDTRVVTAELSFGHGARVTGEMFLRPSFVTASGLESIADRLNDRDAFFPLRVGEPEPRTHIIGKTQVRYVSSAPEPAPFVPQLGEAGEVVELALRIELDDGEELSGLLRAILPHGKRRALDLVNEQEGTFMSFVAGERQVVLNRSFIRRLRDGLR
jgi:hypothetical protein